MPRTNGATAADAGTVAAVTSPSTGWASGDAHHRSRNLRRTARPEPARAMLRRAVQLRVNFIDTARRLRPRGKRGAHRRGAPSLSGRSGRRHQMWTPTAIPSCFVDHLGKQTYLVLGWRSHHHVPDQLGKHRMGRHHQPTPLHVSWMMSHVRCAPS